MRILLLLLVTFSAAFSQSRLDFDTTLSFRIDLRDSIFIPPIGAYIYSQTRITASCPGFYSGDFMDWQEPGRIEKIPSQADFLIDYSAPCGVIPGGFAAETTFTFADRQYRVRTGSGNVFMKVTGVTKTFQVSLKFSSDPFPTSLQPRSKGAGRAPFAGQAPRGFQGMLFRDPENHDWRRVDGRRRRDG